ncbi:MAG: ABC transporter permease [Lachnospiraceae bacterium]|nr:ABC transporter permease [Lachnospiraceae bacterium]MEE3354752.1 ABC transporter permease [Candidatus Weimeria sp.]
MTVFKTILKIAKRDWMTILVYFIVFACFGSLSARGNAQKENETYQDERMEVAVIDHSRSTISKGLIQSLRKTDKVLTPNTEDLTELNDDVRFDIYDYVLILPEDFEEEVKAGKKDAAEYLSGGESICGHLMTEKIRLYLQDVVLYLKSGYSTQEAVKGAGEAILASSHVKSEILSEVKTGESTYLSGIFRFSSYALMMLLTEVIGTILGNIRHSDVRRRIAVSGTSFRKRNIAFYGAVLVVSVLMTGLLIAFVLLASIGDPEYGKIPYYILNEVAIMVCGIGIATTISSITTDSSLISMISNTAVLSMSFLCGIFVPLEVMSQKVLVVSHFLPMYWFAKGIQYINDHGVDAVMSSTFYSYLGIQVLFGVGFFMIGLIIFKKKELYAV